MAGFGPDGIGARSGAPFFGTSGVDEAEENDVHDVVIRNATVIDGLGNPRREGESLAVREGRIVAMGADVGRGAEEIDAGGRVLCPGIVDLHTHFDAQLTWDSYATPSVGLGVTTVVAGNCGFTIAPCREQDRDRTLRNLTHVEGMSLDALREGVDWDFETYPEYLAMLERKGTVPNVACFVGHSSVRTYVLGDEASSRPATPSEVAEMKSIVCDAMEAGAIGFSTTTLEQHNGENGIPMPSRLADEHEMLELTGALGEVGKGVFMLTKGMTSTIPWLEKIAARNGRPVMVAAMFVDPNDPERVFRELDEIGDAKGRGRELWGQVGCFPLGMEFCLAHPYPLEALLAWRPAMEAPSTEEFRRIVSDPSFRDAIKAEARTTGVPLRFSYHQWDHMRIMEAAKPENRDLVGRVVGDLAREAGKDPFDWYLDHCLDGEMDSLVDCHMFNVDEERVKDLLEHPHGGARALRRGRPPLVPLRRRFRPAHARALGAGPGRPDPRAGGAIGDEPACRRLSDQGAGAAQGGRVRRPAALRPRDGGARRARPEVGSSGRRGPRRYPAHRGRGGLDQRPPGGERGGRDEERRASREGAPGLRRLRPRTWPGKFTDVLLTRKNLRFFREIHLCGNLSEVSTFTDANSLAIAGRAPESRFDAGTATPSAARMRSFGPCGPLPRSTLAPSRRTSANFPG